MRPLAWHILCLLCDGKNLRPFEIREQVRRPWWRLWRRPAIAAVHFALADLYRDGMVVMSESAPRVVRYRNRYSGCPPLPLPLPPRPDPPPPPVGYRPEARPEGRPG